jgi:Cytochrome c7 and related cytochrome c
MIAGSLFIGCFLILNLVNAQSRGSKRRAKKPNPRAPVASAAKYSAFLHSSDKHKVLACNDCHKIPTAWTAKRDFPDVADFPDHDACVRCHRQQFFTRQAFAGTGPTICTVCHVRAAPREDARFSFGKPNNSNQEMKPKDERQFTIEFPHDKHQNAIASMRYSGAVTFTRVSFSRSDHNQKIDYNNCSICHGTNKKPTSASVMGWTDSFVPPPETFKTRPSAHDACFECHWKNLKPAGDDCGGCHKPSNAFVPMEWPKRTSVRFNHEGAKGGHVLECTTCHINITRASTLRGLTPDVPITICATCHRDNKKITYPSIVTIETEIDQFKRTSNCAYCHTSDVGKKKPPPSHDAAVE